MGNRTIKVPTRGLLVVLLATAVVRADSPWLYGIHWVGSVSNGSDISQMTGGKPIWTVETVMTDDGYGSWGPQGQLAKFQGVVGLGHTIIMRVQPVWGKAFPLPGDTAPSMAGFLDQVSATANLYKDICHIWYLGNEMNFLSEWGDEPLMPEDYIDAAVQFSDRIKAVTSSLGPQIVLVGPVGVGDTVGGDQHMGCTEYINRMCDHINHNNYHDKFDGFAIHAYGDWSCTDLPCMLHLFETEIGAGYQHQIGVIDSKGFTSAAVYITEWNRYTGSPNGPQEYASAQFLHTAFDRLCTWNQSHHPVVCACWFVYPNDPIWSSFSLLGMKSSGDHDHDCWHAFQYACSLNCPAGSPDEPAIVLSPDSFTRSAYKGENCSPPDDVFTVANSGGGTLNYTITDNVNRLSVLPTGGTSTGEADPITIDYETAGLEPGDHTAEITVTDPNASNPSETVSVDLHIDSATCDGCTNDPNMVITVSPLPYKDTIYYNPVECDGERTGDEIKITMSCTGADYVVPTSHCSPIDDELKLATVTSVPGVDGGCGPVTFIIKGLKGTPPAKAQVTCTAEFYDLTNRRKNSKEIVVNVEAGYASCCDMPLPGPHSVGPD